MANIKRKRTRQSIDTHEIALAALAKGWQPVALHPRSKRPASGEGWNKVRVTESSVTRQFHEDQNVGILWGSPSGWAVDVDLDCAEAITIAPKFLPETYIYGREKRRASHYVYVAKNAETTKWLYGFGKQQEVIIELRSTGSQTVWVGSIHPDDRDTYCVDHDIEATTIDYSDLKSRCGQMAATILLARNYPEGGSRHDYVHSITGGLLRDGYTADIVKLIVGCVVDLRSDLESDPEQRARTVKNTIARDRDGGRTQGWGSIGLPEEELSRIRGYLKGSQLREATRITIVKSKSREAKTQAPLPKIPEGMIADLKEWAARRAHVYGEEFDLAAALTCMALASGNRYLIRAGWDTPLQPYLMVLAPSGAGKDDAFQSVRKFATRVQMQDRVFQGFQSHHAMLDTLGEAPSVACWLWDEAARKLKSAGRSSGSPDYAVMTYLLQMYGKAADGVSGMPGRSNTILAIDKPFLVTLATAQPNMMVEAITQADIATGLIARFLLLDAGNEVKDYHFERQELFPSRIDKRVREFRDVALGADGFISINFAKGVYDRFKAYAIWSRKQMVAGDSEFWNRANQNALIIAGLFAISRGDVKHPVIDDEIFEYATAIATRSVENWIVRMSSPEAIGNGASNHNEKLTRQIETFVASPRELRTKSAKEKALISKGLLPRGLLYRLVRYDKRRDIDDVLKVLIEGDVINEGTKEGTHVYWSN